MRLLSILLLVVIVSAFRCQKETEKELKLSTYYYKQTQCADPWKNNTDDNVTATNVKQYLTGQGLYVAGLQIKADDIAAVCLACQCKSGKTIYVTSFKDDSTKAKFVRIGFQQ